MTKAESRLASALPAVAGYVDAIAFLRLNGTFVSFMSGNTTRIAVESGRGDWPAAVISGAAVLLFLAGVVAGTLVRRWLAWRPVTMMLAALSVLLLAAAGLASAGWAVPALAVVAFAMGGQNVVFEQDGAAKTGLSYVTGTLVKIGEGLAEALRGGARWAWLHQLAQWASLLGGAVLGGLAYGAWGLDALWGAAAVLVLVTGVAALQRF